MSRSYTLQVTAIGVDLAKNIFQVHGVTKRDEVAFNRPLRRARVLPFFARPGLCLVGMEACSTSHYKAGELTGLGHEVQATPPMYVKPYVKRGKTDAIDVEAICEAVTRPTMRFVETKSTDQQALSSLHGARNLMVRQRTQSINALRSMLAEFGVYVAKCLARVISFAQGLLAGSALALPEVTRDVAHNLCGQLGDTFSGGRFVMLNRKDLITLVNSNDHELSTAVGQVMRQTIAF